jgi:hypothetical protein
MRFAGFSQVKAWLWDYLGADRDHVGAVAQLRSNGLL